MVDGGCWMLDGREELVVGLVLSPLILKGKGKGFPKNGLVLTSYCILYCNVMYTWMQLAKN